MKKKKKCITALILMVLLTFQVGIYGCANNNNSTDGRSDMSTEYDYIGKSNKKFEFHTFVGVPSNMRIYNASETSYYIKNLSDVEFDNYYKELYEAGFTIADAPYYVEGEEHNLRMLNAANKYGMKQLIGEVVDDNGFSLLGLLRGCYTDPNGKNYGTYTDDEVRALLKKFMNPYKDHPAFYGLSYWDEPSSIYYDNVARAKRLFEEVCPGKILYVNLYPITTDISALGYKDSSDRVKYATDFVEKVNLPFISYDRYCLSYDSNKNVKIEEDFLYNMQVYRQAADIDGRDLWTYLLSTGHSSGGKEFAKQNSISSFRWQVNSFLAFGGSGISWFTVFPPAAVDSYGTKFGVGLYDRQGRKTESYYFVKAVQEEVHSFESVYFNFDWKNVITVLGSDNEDGFCPSFDYLDENFAITKHDRIADYKCSQDTLIGCFKDKEGNDGFMITNYANPTAEKKDKVEITFNDAKAVAVYRLTEKRIIKLDRNKFEMTLLPGEGIFVIPLN